MNRVIVSVLTIALLLFTGACAHRTRAPHAVQPTPHVEPLISDRQSPPPMPGEVYRETGMASWYGRDFHGRKTANGETYDMYGLSAAHRTLALGTVIRVTNLDSYKSITVRINDRGPFARNRILDLSYGAAKELGYVAQGTAKVKIETVEPVKDAALFTVQAAAFVEEENARMLKERLQRKFETVYIVPFESNVGKFFRVRVGAYPTEEKAERIAGKLTLEGLEPIVVRKD